jgi:hypothetical protein
MQYGGRPFTPWAHYEGGTDMTYCLGTENSAAAWAQGLEYSRRIGKVLGAPATVIVPAGKQKVIRYGCLFAPYEGSTLDEGVVSVKAETGAMAAEGKGGAQRFAADPSFTILKGLEKQGNA